MITRDRLIEIIHTEIERQAEASDLYYRQFGSGAPRAPLERHMCIDGDIDVVELAEAIERAIKESGQ